MKLMIASDIHGSAFYCRSMIEAFEREEADRLLLLGDILYHGPRNDLPAEYAPKKVIAMLNPLKRNLLCVRGNCDTEVDQMVLEFPILADYCFLNLDGQNIYATHGHVWNPGKLPMLKAGDGGSNAACPRVPARARMRATRGPDANPNPDSARPRCVQARAPPAEPGSAKARSACRTRPCRRCGGSRPSDEEGPP